MNVNSSLEVIKLLLLLLLLLYRIIKYVFFSHTLSPRPCNGNVLAIANFFLMYVCIMVYTCSFLGNQLLERCCWAPKGAVVIQRVNVGQATHRLMNQTSRAGNPLLEYLCLCLLTTCSSAVAATSRWFFSNIILHLCWPFCTLWYLRWIVPRLWLTIAALCWLAMLLHLQICNFLFAATWDSLRSSINLSAVWFENCLQALLYCCLTWYNTE